MIDITFRPELGALHVSLTAHGPASARIARYASDQGPALRAAVIERALAPREARPEVSIRIAGRPVRLLAIERSSLESGAALREMLELLELWYGGVVGTSIEDIDRLLEGSVIVVAGARGTSLRAAVSDLIATLECDGALAWVSRVCVALAAPGAGLFEANACAAAIERAAPLAEVSYALAPGHAHCHVIAWAS